jgi:hypothetical protein
MFSLPSLEAYAATAMTTHQTERSLDTERSRGQKAIVGEIAAAGSQQPQIVLPGEAADNQGWRGHDSYGAPSRVC